MIPRTEFDGLPVIEVPPKQHPIAIALRRQGGIDDARVSKREVMIRRGEQWFRYGAPKRKS